MSKDAYRLPEDCDFFAVKNNSSRDYECSPKLLNPHFSDFRGILINGPNTLVWDKSLKLDDYLLTPKGDREGPLKIMLAGLLKLPYGTSGMVDEFKYQVLIVARDQYTSKSFQGRMHRFGSQVPRIDISGYDQTNKGLDSQEYFNIDLVHNLNLPIKQAKYTVYATLGDYTSNLIEVDVYIN